MRKLTSLMIIFISVLSPALAQNPVSTTLQTQQEEKKQSSVELQPTAPQLTAADVEAFLDGVVPLQLDREDIAGATVAIVKDGKLLFAKGYGFSDVAAKKTVSPERRLSFI